MTQAVSVVFAVFSTLHQVILPISIPVMGGWLLKKYQKLDTKSFVSLSLYFLSPALIFDTLYKADISSDEIIRTLSFCILNLVLLWIAAKGWGRLMNLSSSDLAALTLVSTFTNSVNYGLPLVLLAFGQAGLELASVYVIVQIILVNTVGVYFAARSSFSISQSIKTIFKLPAIYAAIAAALLQITGLQVPSGFEKGVSFVSDAFSPLVLCVLGMQMANVGGIGTTRQFRTAFWGGIGIRLFVSPVIAFLILSVLHIEGPLFSVLLILASMPAAVNAVILAEKFAASPQLVSSCILWTTLASFVLLPVLIVILGMVGK